MRLGPEKLCDFLERFRERLNWLTEVGTAFLREHADRIESPHKSALVTSIRGWVFPLVHAVSHEGMDLVGATFSDPFDTTPSPYKLNLNRDSVDSSLEGVITVSGIKSGIIDFPPNTRFMGVVGEDTWISKLVFRERIKGLKRITFSENISESVLNTLERLQGKIIHETVGISIDDTGINLIVFVPESVPQEHVALLAEMSKLIRGSMGLSYSKLSKIPKDRRVLGVFTLDLESLVDGSMDVEELSMRFIDRLRKGYEYFLKGAELI